MGRVNTLFCLGKSSKIKNQRGESLVIVIIAVVIVAVVAYMLSSFVTGITKSSTKLQISGSCEDVANTMVSYFLKDEANLFVTSFGPDSSTVNKTYPLGVNINADGKDQFLFGGTALRASIPPNGITNPYLSLTDKNLTGIGSAIGNVNDATALDGSSEGIPNAWKFNNRMNIRNSMTRLITLASDSSLTGICGSSIEVINTGTDVNHLEGILVPDGTIVKIRLDIFDGNVSLCSSGLLSRIPTSGGAYAKFKVEVTRASGSPNEKKCNSEGRTSFPTDTQPPTTLLTLRSSTINGLLCNNNTVGNPLYCSGESGTLALRAWTIRTPANPANPGDARYLNCRNQLRQKHSQPIRCENNPPQDYFSDSPYSDYCANQTVTNTNRIISDPGSLFLCRIGEANWFTANPDYWEPCERAKVWECTGGSGTTCTGRTDTGATISINYLQQNEPKVTSQYTVADITLSNLRINRFYKYDVRAIDTTMTLAGPSFCSFLNGVEAAGTGCHNSGYGFAYLQAAPDITSPMTATSAIFPSTSIAGSTGGAVNNAAAQGQFPGQYQCNTSELPTFGFGYSYSGIAGPWIFNIFGAEVCSASNGYCNCFGTSCSVTDVFPTSGPNTVSATVTNPCAGGGATTSFSWCVDDIAAYTFDVPDLSGNTQTFPPIQTVNINPEKSCGLVYYYPRIGGGMNYRYASAPGTRTADRTDLNWIDLRDSGCLAHSTAGYLNQQCLMAIDPCGRMKEQTTRRKYQTLLALSTRDGPITDNSCDVDGMGRFFDGNACVSGWCGTDYKCYANGDYEYFGDLCTMLEGSKAPNGNPGEEACFYSLQTRSTESPICGTSYTCRGTDGSGNIHEDTGLDISRCDVNSVPTPNACSMSDTCTGGTKTCDGTAGGTPCPDNSWPNPCPGTCQRIPGTGTCQRQSSLSCTTNADCPDINGTCQVDQQQNCSAPTNTTLFNPMKMFVSPPHCADLNSCQVTTCNWVRDKHQCLGVCGSAVGTRINSGTCPCDPTGALCNLGTVPNPNGPPSACTKSPNTGPTAGSFCGYTWVEQSRSACLGPCGDQGEQTINYVCKDSGGAVVDDLFCAPNPDRPAEVVLCTKPNPAVDENGVACACQWDVTVTESCRGECGYTTGTEQITSACSGTGCLSADGNFCGGIPKPESPRACIKDTATDTDGTSCSGGVCRIRRIGYSGCSNFCGGMAPPDGPCMAPGCDQELIICPGGCMDCDAMSVGTRVCWNSGGGCTCYLSGDGYRSYICP